MRGRNNIPFSADGGENNDKNLVRRSGILTLSIDRHARATSDIGPM